MFYLYVNKYVFVETVFPLQTVSVAYLQRKIQLSGFSACPDICPSQLIRISGVLMYVLHFSLQVLFETFLAPINI